MYLHQPCLNMQKDIAKGEDTAKRYSNYIDDVKNGKKKLIENKDKLT